ncbi:CPBP family intramembrane metalloprotease [Lentisphaera marina]|uniref:CPBP family intramembrane glutamic endopeptidase n=1 Tax=Lentisphaera marina TaxID=1111041 RepID=UPI002367363D|nr:CPBP family intramembrane glutamic endopeptidase [Lentisphaera marina]MDD7984316.1 CPBP family intramembrane metalloprotease [Lentisphaera marina]
MNEDRKKIGALTIYLFSVFILGSLICPLLWELIHSTALQKIDSIGDASFGKVCNRAFMLVAFVGLWPLAKQLNCTSKDDFGLAIPRKSFFKEFGMGFIFGAITLLCLALFFYFIELRILKSGPIDERIIKGIRKGIVTGIAVGLIEEIFFRGILTRILSRIGTLFMAILISSTIYAAVHFIKGDSSTDYEVIHWYSGFIYLKSAFSLYSDPRFIGSFLTLLTVGIFLAALTLKRGNIALAAGIHAGWVSIIKGNSNVTRTDLDSPHFWLVGNYDKFTGYAAFIWLALICIGTWIYLEKTKKRDA